MTPLQKALIRACNDHSLDVKLNFRLEISPNNFIEALALISEPNKSGGMLIVTDYEVIQPKHQQLLDLGYGYSTMSEYTNDELYDSNDWKEIFSDWFSGQ